MLNTGWTGFAAASRVGAIPTFFIIVTLKGIGHGDKGVYDFRCPWSDLGRRDTKKTRGSRWARIHIHVYAVHGRLLPFNLRANQRQGHYLYASIMFSYNF